MKNKTITLMTMILVGLLLPAGTLFGQACDQLISYWRMEEKSGTTFTDIISGHHATAPVAAPVREAGKVGKAQSFNGTNSYLMVSDNPDFDWSGSQSFTIEMWVKLKSIASAENMVFFGRDETPGLIHWWIGAEKNTGRSMFTLINSSGTSNISYGPNLAIGTWYHIAAVRNATTGTNLFYVNNVMVDSDVVDYSSGSFGTDAPISMGVLHYNGTPNRFFSNVVMDEVAIYDVALSTTDISSHYNNGVFGIGYCQDYSPYFLSIPDSLGVVGETFTYEAYATGLPTLAYAVQSGPGSINQSGVYTWTPTSIDQSGTRIVISATNSQGTVTQSFKIFVAEAPDCPSGINNMYKLNDLSAPYVDFSGGNDGEALNPPTPVAGKFGGAMQFDGVNDGINLPNDGYDFAASSSFSMEFWVKTPGSTSNKVCIGRQGTFGDTDTSDLHMWVGVQANTGTVIFYLRDSWGFEPPTTGLLTGGDVNDNQWHYVVAVRDGVSKKTYLYVDGSEVAVSEAYDYPHSFGSFPEDPMNIGFLYRQIGTPDYFFNGAMDEVAIYTKALSATEVSNNYVKSFTGKWHCAPGNYAPGFVTDPVTDVTEDALYTYDIETMDIDQDDVLSLTVSEKPDWLTFTNLGNGMGTLSGTPQDEDIGDHNVVLSVTDTKSTVDQEFTIHVANQSDAPVITSTPLTTIDEDTPYSYTIVASDPDAGDVITYSATTLPSWLTFNPATHVLSGIPENEDVGDHQVVLLVTDGTNPVEQPFTITVVNVNDPPSISGQNTKVTNEDVSFTITLADLTVVDVDNDPADLTLHVEAGLNYTFTGNTITPAQDYNGMLVVNVHVNDLQGSSSSFGVEVTVAPVNDAPVITSEPIRTAIINKLYGFVLSATDVDGDNLVKSAVSIPAFLNFDPGTGILGGTPAASDYGEHIVALKVSDGTVEVPVNFTLTVSYDVGVENQSVIKRVYPVPASEYLIIEYGIEQDGTIMVIDLAGKHLIEEHVSSSDEMIRLDVTGLEEGMYMYRFQSGDEVTIRTFIISR